MSETAPASTARPTSGPGSGKERRGFASMSLEDRRRIASKGGKAAHKLGTGHEWTSEEARKAGQKGGQVSRGGRGRVRPEQQPPAATDEQSIGEEVV